MPKLTNKYGLPEAIARAVAHDEYSRGDADISVTQLVAPPRLVALYEQHKDEIEEDVSERIWVLLGKAIHKILADAGEDAIVEERLYTEVFGWKVSGQFDSLSIAHLGRDVYKLTDWKVTSAWAVRDGVKPEWEAQLNLYALLLERAGFTISALRICAILRDWNRYELQRSPNYPPLPVVEMAVPLWSLDQQSLYLHRRVQQHQRAQEGELPLCDDLDRWAKPAKWAVVKKGQKRALRVFDTEREAFEMAATVGAEVEFRPPTYPRCENYCPVAQWCSQWQGETGGEE
jgi:hypothetical protein